jgi:hypothetical protein
MRRAVSATVLAASVFAAALPSAPHSALAQATSQTASKPPVVVDLAELPPLPPVVPSDERRQAALIATGAGAAIGVLLADILTGGMLLAPLGVPSASALFSAQPAAVAAPAVAATGAAVTAVAVPTYTVAQELLAGVASFAAAVGGGYVGSYLARTRPDLVGLPQ